MLCKFIRTEQFEGSELLETKIPAPISVIEKREFRLKRCFLRKNQNLCIKPTEVFHPLNPGA